MPWISSNRPHAVPASTCYTPISVPGNAGRASGRLGSWWWCCWCPPPHSAPMTSCISFYWAPLSCGCRVHSTMQFCPWWIWWLEPFWFGTDFLGKSNVTSFNFFRHLIKLIKISNGTKLMLWYHCCQVAQIFASSATIRLWSQRNGYRAASHIRSDLVQHAHDLFEKESCKITSTSSGCWAS